MVSLSVVIPVYNSALSLPNVIERLKSVLPSMVEAYEVVFVDDGSKDNSWQVITQLATKYSEVRGYRLMRNFGQHNALLCGIAQARYELIVTMDDDLQHPPEEIVTLLVQLTPEIDVVYGAPQQERHGFLRDIASRVTKAVMQQAIGAENAQNMSAFRLFRTPLRQAFLGFRGPYVSIDVLLTWATSRFSYVRVAHHKRAVGQSGYTLRKLITHTFNMVTGFSTLPLQLASLLGFLLTLFGALLLFYIIVVRIIVFGYDVPGFTFLASVVSLFAGAQMFMLGIIGEYLARVHFRVMDKPAFVVSRQADANKGETAYVVD